LPQSGARRARTWTSSGKAANADRNERVVGLDIQHASETMDLRTLEAESLPAGRTRIA